MLSNRKQNEPRARLQLAAVVLDEAAVGEEELLPHNGGAQRRRTLKDIRLQGGRTRSRLRRRARVRPAAPDLRGRRPRLPQERCLSSAVLALQREGKICEETGRGTGFMDTTHEASCPPFFLKKGTLESTMMELGWWQDVMSLVTAMNIKGDSSAPWG